MYHMHQNNNKNKNHCECRSTFMNLNLKRQGRIKKAPTATCKALQRQQQVRFNNGVLINKEDLIGRCFVALCLNVTPGKNNT